MFAGKEREFEANLGTSDLFEMLTGKNLFVQFSAFNGIDPNTIKGSGALKYAGVLEIYKRLAYVMNVQAESPDIATMRGKMNIDSYLEWIFQFSVDDFTEEFTKEIAALWKSNSASNATPKNP